MAARLHNNTTVPAGGFRYWVAETETWIRGATYPDWRDKTVKHCKSNELDPPSEEAMIDQLCEQLDGNWCEYATDSDRNKAERLGRLTREKLLAGTKTLVEWFANGREKVVLSVAEDRAKVCSKCFYNQNAEGCTPCASKPIRMLVNKIVGGDKTSLDQRLQACRICGCSNKAQIWLSLELLQKHLTKSVRASLPEWCWKG